MLSLQEISDKLEIQQLMVDYAEALDTLQIDKMDDVFTPDAYIDYRAMGGIDGKYPEIREWLKDQQDRLLQPDGRPDAGWNDPDDVPGPVVPGRACPD